jgi:hypothetical protein
MSEKRKLIASPTDAVPVIEDADADANRNYEIKYVHKPPVGPTMTDDGPDDVAPAILAIGRLLCGNSPLGIRGSRQIPNGVPHLSPSVRLPSSSKQSHSCRSSCFTN